MVFHLQIDADPDPDPAYHFDADPDQEPIFQFDVNSWGSGSATLLSSSSLPSFPFHFRSHPSFVSPFYNILNNLPFLQTTFLADLL